MKNEKPASHNPQSVNGPDPLTFYITLQGTVFLYPQEASANLWPLTHTVGAMPPTTIVAEFVPLKPAGRSGHHSGKFQSNQFHRRVEQNSRNDARANCSVPILALVSFNSLWPDI